MGSGRHVDHEQCLGKIKSLARAEELDKNDENELTQSPKEKKCTNCEIKYGCKKFNGKMFAEGSYSIIYPDVAEVCNKWKPKKTQQKIEQDIKKLMKQFKKALR